eukprot:Em0017g957a
MSTCSSISLLLVLACFVSGEELGVVYDITVEPYETKTVNFPSVPTNKPVRVVVKSSEVNVSKPLLVTASQSSRVVLVQLPTVIERIAYTRAERTLCLPCPAQDNCPAYPVTVVFTSYSNVNTTVSLSVFVVNNYYLSTHTPVTLTAAPNAPQHFMFLYNGTISGVLVKYTSSDTTCALASIQYATCPDDSSSVPVGMYQWMERVAAMSTARKPGDDPQYFYAVVAVFPSGLSNSCSSVSVSSQSISTESSVASSKNVTLELLESLSEFAYTMGVLVPTVVFMSSYIIALVWIVVFDWIRYFKGSVFMLKHHNRHGNIQQPSGVDEADGRGGEEEEGVAAPRRPALCSVLSGAYSMEVIQPISRMELSSWNIQAQDRNQSVMLDDDPDDPDDPDGTHDPDDPDGTHDPDDPDGTHVPDGTHGTDDIDGTNDDLHGTNDDLHGTSQPTGDHHVQYEYIGQLKFAEHLQPHNHYVWFLLSMVILYGIPAYQLALAYQMQFDLSGNQEICYYNFLCSQQLQISSFTFAAFNNVFSNVGYVILGLLILLLNYRRRNIHRAFERHNETLTAEEKLGVPTHFGVYYASGMALVAIGAMSAAYHLCPSRRNYQFDTTFMYVLAGLGIYRLLKARNPDITPKMHQTMLSIAVLILLVVIGGLYAPEEAGWPMYAIFSFIYLLVCVIVTVEIYYRWTINNCRSLKTTLKQARYPPDHKPKFWMVIALSLLNLIILVIGLIIRSSDFATYVLAILICNLLLILIYYCTVKCFYKEWKRDWDSMRPIAYLLLSLIFWALGIYFYLGAATDWLKSPAASRNGNFDCLVFKFYDYHDCWHFSSACALFFTVLMLMALDDQQRLTQRKALKVF